MNKNELKEILLGQVEAAAILEEKVAEAALIKAELLRDLLRIMRNVPFTECVKLSEVVFQVRN